MRTTTTNVVLKGVGVPRDAQPFWRRKRRRSFSPARGKRRDDATTTRSAFFARMDAKGRDEENYLDYPTVRAFRLSLSLFLSFSLSLDEDDLMTKMLKMQMTMKRFFLPHALNRRMTTTMILIITLLETKISSPLLCFQRRANGRTDSFPSRRTDRTGGRCCLTRSSKD